MSYNNSSAFASTASPLVSHRSGRSLHALNTFLLPRRHPQPIVTTPRHAPSTLTATAAHKREAALRARRSLTHVDIPSFDSAVKQHAVPSTLHPLTRATPTTLQVNIGLTCNQACHHCHVESSPSRLESMPRRVVDRLIRLAADARPHLRVVDVTGGAPELHAEFRYLVEGMTALGLEVIDRCNLTVLFEEGQHDLVAFLARHRVRVIASLPCYSASNVERQRGNGVFDASVRGLQMMNEVGYGREGSGLSLDLVYNPIGPTLPPPQAKLQVDYKRELAAAFGIHFNNLICITNMPIKRFADDLLRSQRLQEYMTLLGDNFNGETVTGLMCRHMVHVAWDGTLHDCDFNYALGMPVLAPEGRGDGALTVFDIESLGEAVGWRIATGKHCYGCTAGSGSSCGGELA